MSKLSRRWLAVAFAAALSAACGSSPSPSAPTSPTSPQLTVPTGFREVSQKINPKDNTFQLAWAGDSATYQLVIGSMPGSSDILPPTVVTGTTYTWVSPRTGGAYYARVASKSGDAISGYANELSLYVLDVRNVIDGLFFHAGPLADKPSNANSNPVASVWADGTHLRILVSQDAGEAARANAQTFADQYAALVGGTITATAELTSDTMKSTDYRNLPEFTIGVRVLAGACGGGAALGCIPSDSGPAPAGPNKSMVSLEQAGALNVYAVAHELGHAYGMGHITTPSSGRPEFRFMMNPSVASEQMTDVEKLAIRLAYGAGLRAGSTRSWAQDNDLVNPYTGSTRVR